MSKQKRVFTRENQDGTSNTVTMEWESDKPTSTFSMEADGYKGASCLSELGNIEDIIGISTIDEKAEMYEGEDERDVFIVGMN